MDFQVARIIHRPGQENTRESVWDFLLKFKSWERLTGQLWARSFPLAAGAGKLGTLINSFKQQHAPRKHPKEDGNRGKGENSVSCSLFGYIKGGQVSTLSLPCGDESGITCSFKSTANVKQYEKKVQKQRELEDIQPNLQPALPKKTKQTACCATEFYEAKMTVATLICDP